MGAASAGGDQGTDDGAAALATFRALLDETSDFVVILEPDGHASYVNRATAEFLGLEPGPLPPVTLDDVLTPASRTRLEEEVLPVLARDRRWRGELALVGAHGNEVPASVVLVAHQNGNGTVERLSVVARDVTEQRALHEQLARQALEDPLTGLPNRRLLVDHLDLALARATRAATPAGVLFIDVDHFKDVNDRFGHEGGDRALVAVSDRLRTAMRPADTVARVGGDEFVVLCEGLGSGGDPAHDALGVAARITGAVEKPIDLDGTPLELSVSVGVALAAGDDDPERVLRHADAAMYEAKRAGRNAYRLWAGA
jgi:diguanylate cyclase (GGDEF)-like protein/PAS domain S-box-containing protein